MSYQSQAALEADYLFQQRARAVAIQQADTYKDDGRPDIAATAISVLRDDPGMASAFVRLGAAGPGIADKVDTGDGVDQALVTDADLLALTQANYPVVAVLYFDADGSPLDVP